MALLILETLNVCAAWSFSSSFAEAISESALRESLHDSRSGWEPVSPRAGRGGGLGAGKEYRF